MTNDLKIPKQETRVEVLLIEQDEFKELSFFLSHMSATHQGEETVSEFLNGECPFVPVGCGDSGVILLNLDNIVAVRTKEEVPETVRRNLQITVQRDRRFDVQQVDPMPPGHDRAVDFLNLEKRFLTFREGNRMLYIQRQHIIQAVDQ